MCVCVWLSGGDFEGMGKTGQFIEKIYYVEGLAMERVQESKLI